MHELTQKLSASEKQNIYEIINKNIEKAEKLQLNYPDLSENLFEKKEEKSTSSSSISDENEFLREFNVHVNYGATFEDEKLNEKKTIFQSHINYGSTLNENKKGY